MAVDDDDELIPEVDEEFVEGEEVDDIDPADLDEEAIEDDLEADEFGGLDDDLVVADDEEDEDDDTGGPVRRSVSTDDDDDDDDMLAPDDVEADLDTILKDRMVAADDEDDEEDEPEERGETADRLQPKRADEQLCPSCFLLVRQGAPMCPVGDDDCPLFS